MFAIIHVTKPELCCFCPIPVSGIVGAQFAILDFDPNFEEEIPTEPDVRVFCDAHFAQEAPEEIRRALLKALGEPVPVIRINPELEPKGIRTCIVDESSIRRDMKTGGIPTATPVPNSPLKPSPSPIPDSPALAYIGKGSNRQAIGWARYPDDLQVEDGMSGAIVIYEGESTSEGFGEQEDCEPSDAEQCVDDLDNSAGFEWAATQEVADWYSLVYGTEITMAQLEKGATSYKRHGVST